MSGDHGDALERYIAVLSEDPANLEALRGAAECSAAVGDHRRAEGFRRLLRSLDRLADAANVAPAAETASQTRTDAALRNRVFVAGFPLAGEGL